MSFGFVSSVSKVDQGFLQRLSNDHGQRDRLALEAGVSLAFFVA